MNYGTLVNGGEVFNAVRALYFSYIYELPKLKDINILFGKVFSVFMCSLTRPTLYLEYTLLLIYFISKIL